MKNIPDSWQYKTLGEVAKWGSGGTPRAGTKSFYDGDIPWAIIGDLNDSYVSQTARNITQKGLEESSAKLVPVGSVLIAMYGSIGKLGINTIPMATNQAIAFAIPKTDLILQKYLFLYLSSQREILLWSGKGATQQNISQTLLKSWKIPLPPLSEQNKIVEILEDHLSRLDAALVDVKQAREKAAVFRRSLLQAAFTGNLGHNESRFIRKLPSGWVTQSLKDWEMQAQSGFASGEHNSDGNGVIHLRPMNISRLGKLNFENVKSVEDDSTRRIKQGDILFNNTNSAELVGKTTIIDIEGDFAFSNHMTRLRFPAGKVLHKYMAMLLHSLWMSGFFNQICSNHVNQASVSIKRLEQVKVSLPPLSEQKKIVEILENHLSRLDSFIALADSMEKQSASLRRALLQKAFVGQLTKEVASV